MSAPNRKGMGLGDAILVWLAIGFIVIVGGGAYAAVHIGSWMAGLPTPRLGGRWSTVVDVRCRKAGAGAPSGH